MPYTICGIIVPRQHQIIPYRKDKYLAECLRSRHITGPHVFRSPNGTYYAWEDDEECDCCEPGDPDRCTIHRILTESEARALLEE